MGLVGAGLLFLIAAILAFLVWHAWMAGND